MAGTAYFKIPLFGVSSKFYVSSTAFIFQASVMISTFNCDISATAYLDNSGSFTASINDAGLTEMLVNLFVSTVDKTDFSIPSIIPKSSYSSLFSKFKSFASNYARNIKITFGGPLSVTSDFFLFSVSLGSTTTSFSCNLKDIKTKTEVLFKIFITDLKNYAKDEIKKLANDLKELTKAACNGLGVC